MKTVLFNPSSGPGAQHDSTGQVPVPANVSGGTLVASLHTEGVGCASVQGVVNSSSAGAITDLIVQTACAPHSTNGGYGDSGNSVPRVVASAGDFATLTDLVTAASTGIGTNAPGTSFYFDLDLRGRFHRVDIYIKSTAGSIVTIDATNVSLNVG